MGALEPQFWARFCAGVGREDLTSKQYEPTGSDAWAEIAQIFRSRTRSEWKAFNDEHDAMIEPVLDLDEALDSALVREREMVVEWEQPGIGPVRQLGVPVRCRGPRGRSRRPGARLEHTDDVLRGDFSADEIAALLAAAPRRGRAPRRRPRGSCREQLRRGAAADQRAGRARGGPRRHRAALPARGPARAGEDVAQHGYPPEFVDRIRLIKQLQEERFMPLRVIRDLLAREDAEPTPACGR